MFRSLRFRVPALFLVAIALAGVVASLIAIRLFQDYTRAQALAEVRREAVGLAALYAGRAAGEPIDTRSLERTIGDEIYWATYPGLDLEFAREETRKNIRQLERLPASVVPGGALRLERLTTFEFTPAGEDRVFLAAAQPVRVGQQTFGALVVATPEAELRESWMTLFERLALAFLGGVVIAGVLGLYLSRRITKPVLALSRAADEVAEGRYDIRLPRVRGRGEIAHLTERFEEMTTRLRESVEMERNFLMSVSHELRTPLTAIRGHVEAMREGLVEDPELRAASLDTIAAEAQRLERLVGDVLDLAKLDARRFAVVTEEVDLKRVVDRAFTAFEREAHRRSIAYRRDVRAEPVIATDGDRVLQIISNLLANAFRWTPDGGRIAVDLTAEDGHVAVAVEDSGPGIPPEERERIFRPFWSSGGGGTGLGLAIARELAHALGGRVDLDSTPGRGSRFELVLPASPPTNGSRFS